MRCAAACAVLAGLITALSTGLADDTMPPAASPSKQSAPEIKIDPMVEQLVKDLGADDYRTREKAGRELAAKGEKILPSLRTALSSAENPEVRRRLLVIVRRMDYDRLVSPKLVTMSLKGKTVRDAFAEIGKQTGYKIEYNGNRSASELKQNFEFDKAPFWQAVDKVAGVAGCSIFNDYNSEDGTIQIMNQDTINPYVAYAGPYRIIAISINSNKDLQLANLNRRVGGLQRQESLNLNVQILSEPKNPMLGVTKVELISGVDDLGGALTAPRGPNQNQVNYYNNGMSRGHNVGGNLALSRADKTATAIKTLKAKAGIILLSGTIPEIVVNNPLKVEKKTFTGRTLEIDFGSFAEDANNKGHYSLDVTMKKLGQDDPNGQQDFNWMNSAWQKIEVLDAAGNRYQCFGPNSINNNGLTIQVTMVFGPENRRGQTSKVGPPAKVLVNEWLTVVHEVTFDFKDIPLP